MKEMSLHSRREGFVTVMASVEILEMTYLMSKVCKMSSKGVTSSLENRRCIKLEWDVCDVPTKMTFTGMCGGDGGHDDGNMQHIGRLWKCSTIICLHCQADWPTFL